MAKAQREVLLLRQDLRDLYEVLGLYEASRSPMPHEQVGAAIQQVSSIRRQNTQLKQTLQAQVESTLANSSPGSGDHQHTAEPLVPQ